MIINMWNSHHIQTYWRTIFLRANMFNLSVVRCEIGQILCLENCRKTSLPPVGSKSCKRALVLSRSIPSVFNSLLQCLSLANRNSAKVHNYPRLYGDRDCQRCKPINGFGSLVFAKVNSITVYAWRERPINLPDTEDVCGSQCPCILRSTLLKNLLFCCYLFMVFMALSTVFHSINSPDNTPLSHCSFGLIFV